MRAKHFFVLQQQQNLGWRFGTSKMHLSPPPPSVGCCPVVLLLLLIRCWLLLPLWDSVIVLCFDVRYFVSILALQSSWCGRENWLLCLVFLVARDCCVALFHDATGFPCSLSLWYFLIIMTYYFCRGKDDNKGHILGDNCIQNFHLGRYDR